MIIRGIEKLRKILMWAVVVVSVFRLRFVSVRDYSLLMGEQRKC